MDSSSVVARATLVLHYYATTQIDQLLAIASSDLTQRWDFLGPLTRDFASASFFSDVDTALQWHNTEVAIGDFIRHSHFALELTEEQAEALCPANIRFDVASGVVHALAPFATSDADGVLTLAVDLMMENSEWRYFDVVACKGRASEFQSPRSSELYSTYEEACAKIPSDPVKSTEDDDYWGQYSEEEEEEEEKEDDGGRSEEAAAPAEHSSTHLIAEAGKHALLGAAAAMRALGATEEQFVDQARQAFRGSNTDKF
ncbi:hypothetical protein IWW57_005446 [Coemansia sp. S610]|uniref:Uncharacterized protein n=1 Tax=Coemansia linderi TaxID=2663919 RepID=A0ACC1KIW1_9FUNG|nr:hypothetical protein IWW57_005446 [Coemansia sp. S610]KAJ2352587.1 hypothetical protein H4S02_013430 [Coemansia sp. RSA 2611]KAJ2698893.1 hypothetical protein H4218_003018 [Coemansia sp. IMI 209128]KAJ2790547.1 hypothetical protein GGI18_001730 [Coemansia linderi]